MEGSKNKGKWTLLKRFEVYNEPTLLILVSKPIKGVDSEPRNFISGDLRLNLALILTREALNLCKHIAIVIIFLKRLFLELIKYMYTGWQHYSSNGMGLTCKLNLFYF